MVFFISNVLHRIDDTITQKKYARLLPSNHTLSDVFLVSFPKSGNTWLRFLIANAIKVHFEIDRQVSFFTIHDIIPDIYLSRNLAPHGPFGRTDLPRMIKSHAAYNPYYFRVILLVRDPRDVMISYYHYLKERNTIAPNFSFSEFISSKKYGVSAWNQHTQSWYATLKQGQTIQIFQYESFLRQPQQTLYRLMDLLGIGMSDRAIETAIALCSKDNMKQSENTHRSTYLMQHQTRPFVRQGEATGRKLSETDRSLIETATRDTARWVGYDY